MEGLLPRRHKSPPGRERYLSPRVCLAQVLVIKYHRHSGNTCQAAWTGQFMFPKTLSSCWCPWAFRGWISYQRCSHNVSGCQALTALNPCCIPGCLPAPGGQVQVWRLASYGSGWGGKSRLWAPGETGCILTLPLKEV